MTDIYEVANWFLTKSAITPKKLQKLVYYAYSWYMVLLNESADEINNFLFSNKPEAWVHGPVFPELYERYKEYSYNEIPQGNNEITFNEDIEDILEQVWEVYGGFNANELESLTHEEDPWINARGDCSKYEICKTKLDDIDIFKCYSDRLS